MFLPLKNLVGRVGKLIAESIQLHGGIAMTWEYSVAHYAKRLIMIDHLMGDAIITGIDLNC